MSKILIAFLHILSSIVNRRGIDWSLFNDFSVKDWEQLYTLSKNQGDVAVIFEEIKNIPKSIAPPKTISLKCEQRRL